MIRKSYRSEKFIECETKDIVERLGDAESGDLMVERMTEHGKTAWMLRAQLA